MNFGGHIQTIAGIKPVLLVRILRYRKLASFTKDHLIDEYEGQD